MFALIAMGTPSSGERDVPDEYRTSDSADNARRVERGRRELNSLRGEIVAFLCIFLIKAGIKAAELPKVDRRVAIEEAMARNKMDDFSLMS